VYLKPDYGKSVDKVYGDATRYMMRKSESLDVLSHIEFVAPFLDSSREALFRRDPKMGSRETEDRGGFTITRRFGDWFSNLSHQQEIRN